MRNDAEADKAKNTFADRLQDLIAESRKNIKALSAEIGISTGALSKYQNGGAEAGITALWKIADHFNVTTDWLLGRSDNRTVENASIGEQLGLSDKAIAQIRLAQEFRVTDSLNSIISSPHLFSLIRSVSDYRKTLYDKHALILQGAQTCIDKKWINRTIDQLYPKSSDIDGIDDIDGVDVHWFLTGYLDIDFEALNNAIELGEYKAWKELRSILSSIPEEVLKDARKDVQEQKCNALYNKDRTTQNGKEDDTDARKLYAQRRVIALRCAEEFERESATFSGTDETGENEWEEKETEGD